MPTRPSQSHEPDDAKLKERYEADKSRFMTPEYRKFEMLTLSVDDLKKQMTVTDDEVAKSYADDQGQLRHAGAAPRSADRLQGQGRS